MIITETVKVKISPANSKYWRSLGYNIGPTGGRDGMNTGEEITVKVSELKPKSNVSVKCICDWCQSQYIQRYSRNTDVCELCRVSERTKGNTYGSAHKGKSVPKLQGANHPRWNPNKKEFSKYSTKVRCITERNYKLHKEQINHHKYPRGLCGVPGAYQLDHIISTKRGFEENICPSVIGAVGNLQMLSWEDNRAKWI